MKISKKLLVFFICSFLGVLLVIGAAVLSLRAWTAERRYDRYFEQATLSYRDRDWQSARDALSRAMALDDTEDCYLLLAEIYAASGDLDAAVGTLYAATLKYDSPMLRERLAALREQQREEDGGEDGTVTIGGEHIKTDVTSLILSDRGLTGADLSPLAALTELESLSLADNDLTELSFLPALRKLTFLHLGGNRITDLSPLASLGALKTLYLDGNPVEDLTPLYALKNLRTLSLQDIEVGSNELEALQEALPDCRIFCDIVLEEPKEITLGGVTFLSDVTDLDLSGRGLTDIAALSACTALTRLDLSGNAISDLTPLAELKELSWLSLWDNRVQDIRPLLTLPKLVYLDLDQNELTDIGILGELLSLEELWLGSNKPASFEPLGNLRKLRRLGLNDTGFGDEDLPIVMKLTSLTELRLEDNEAFTAGGLDALKEALPDCTVKHSELHYVIRLGGVEYTSEAASIRAENAGVTDLRGLEKFTNLKSLILNKNSVSELTPLAALTGLELLELGDNRIADIAPLGELGALKRLDLRGNRIVDLSPLAALGKLEYLDLRDNRLSDLIPLYALSGLRTLILSGNPDLSAEQVVALQEALPACSVVTDLDLTPPSPTGTPAP